MTKNIYDCVCVCIHMYVILTCTYIYKFAYTYIHTYFCVRIHLATCYECIYLCMHASSFCSKNKYIDNKDFITQVFCYYVRPHPDKQHSHL